MTRNQALAFVEAMDKSPKVKAHLQAELGWKGVPTAEDFEATHAEGVERCDELIGFLGEVTETLQAIHDSRPKQKEIKLRENEVTVTGGEVITRKTR